jgi:integrase
MKGHIRERSPGRWAIVIDARAHTGERKRRWHSFKGTKRQAQVECARLVASVGQGDYLEPTKTTVADFVASRINQWEAAGEISARTAQRYRQLLEHQIVPHIGAKVLRKLRPLDIEQWHSVLRNTLAARTIGHAHRVLSKALKDAVRNDLVTRNAAREQPAPKVEGNEKAIVRDVPALVAKLKDWRHGTVAMVALFGGLRLGEVLALRWNNVNLDAKVIHVRMALEQTLVHGIRFKAPKSKAGRRDITLPDILVDALREHRKAQLELRSCPTMRCCSPPSTASHWRRIWSRCRGTTSPAMPASGKSLFTLCGTRTRASSSTPVSISRPFQSASGTPRRQSPCPSTRTGSGAMTARRRPRLTR